MSAINTNSIDVNYPIPGQNNTSQGFRNNFASIKTNLDTAGNEITDLQNKVVLKAALNNATLNNDMANTLISNASTRSFRATTYNLGNALAGTVLVDASLGDLQYGNVSGNVTLNFGSWAPTGTEQVIKLQLGFSNSSAVVTFPTEVVYSNNNFGTTLIENYEPSGNITVPYNVEQLNFELRTIDCGNTIFINPINRPFKSTQVIERTPAPTGFQGDTAGTVAVDDSYIYVCTGNFNSVTTIKTATNTTVTTNIITFSTPHGLVDPTNLNVPIIFTGTTFGGIVANTIYYVKSIPSSTQITISDSRTAGVAGSTFALTTASGSMTSSYYIGTDIWKRASLSSW